MSDIAIRVENCILSQWDASRSRVEGLGKRYRIGRAQQRGAVAELGDNQLSRNSGQSGPAFVDGSAERLSAVPQYCREQALQDDLFWVEDREQSGDAGSHWRDELGERGYSFGVAAVGSGQQPGEDRTAVALVERDYSSLTVLLPSRDRPFGLHQVGRRWWPRPGSRPEGD